MRPFTRLSRDVLVANEWHRYCRDRYVQSDGSEGVYYYVDMPGSAGAIALFDDGTTTLCRVRRYLLGDDFWEFPLGGMRPGESALEAARRELEEETGLVGARWETLGRFAPYKGVSNEICHFFLVRGLHQTAQALEPSERISVHRVPLTDARRLLVDQECGDGQSLVALSLLDRWLARGHRL